MNCPTCSHGESKTIDSRAMVMGNARRRRRECLSCCFRWTTYEVMDDQWVPDRNAFQKKAQEDALWQLMGHLHQHLSTILTAPISHETTLETQPGLGPDAATGNPAEPDSSTNPVHQPTI